MRSDGPHQSVQTESESILSPRIIAPRAHTSRRFPRTLRRWSMDHGAPCRHGSRPARPCRSARAFEGQRRPPSKSFRRLQPRRDAPPTSSSRKVDMRHIDRPPHTEGVWRTAIIGSAMEHRAVSGGARCSPAGRYGSGMPCNRAARPTRRGQNSLGLVGVQGLGKV